MQLIVDANILLAAFLLAFSHPNTDGRPVLDLSSLREKAVHAPSAFKIQRRSTGPATFFRKGPVLTTINLSFKAERSIKKAVTREFFLDSRLHLEAPEYLLSETLRHLQSDPSIRKRIGLPPGEIAELFLLLTSRIKVFPETAYQPFMKNALSLAAHREDAPYLAMGLMLKAAVWSNDKGFKEQKSITVYSTHELLIILQRMSG